MAALALQLHFHPLELPLVLLLHVPDRVHQLLYHFESFFDSVVLLVGIAHLFSFPRVVDPLAFEFLLQFDDFEGELFDFLLVDVGEVLDVGVVELFDGLGKFCIDGDEFL